MSFNPDIEKILLKNPGMTVADAQLSAVCRRLPLYFIILMLFPVSMAFQFKNDVGGRKSGINYNWVGEWVEKGESCNANRYRIRRSHFAAPGESLKRVGHPSRPTKYSTKLKLSSGAAIDLESTDWMTLSFSSSENSKALILERCLNPFKNPSSRDMRHSGEQSS